MQQFIICKANAGGNILIALMCIMHNGGYAYVTHMTSDYLDTDLFSSVLQHAFKENKVKINPKPTQTGQST